MSSSTIGCGLCPAGTSVAGIGSVATATAPSTNYLNTAQGTQGECRFIDPVTRDYVFRADGTLQGMNGTQQLVLLAVTTVKDSSAIRGFGLGLNTKTIPSNYALLVRSAVEQALSDLTAKKLISITSIDVKRLAETRLIVSITFMDLQNQIERTVTV